MKSVNSFTIKDWQICLTSETTCRHSMLTSRSYLDQSKRATWRLQYNKVGRKKSLRNIVLCPEIWLNLSWFAGWSKRKWSWKLELTWNIISEHLFQLSLALFGSLLIALFSQWFQTQLAFLQANAGWELGTGHWGKKKEPLCFICCAWRENLYGVHIMCREV